jgi:hypothetical protein
MLRPFAFLALNEILNLVDIPCLEDLRFASVREDLEDHENVFAVASRFVVDQFVHAVAHFRFFLRSRPILPASNPERQIDYEVFGLRLADSPDAAERL